MEAGETAMPSVQKSTHILDLDDECLNKVLSLVGKAQLPIKRPMYRDIQVTHPLQCALVCKRWRSCARAAVHTINLVDLEAEATLAQRAPHLPALKHLALFSDNRCPGSLPEIALATPELESLELDWTFRYAQDVSKALLSWKRLKRLHLAGTFIWDQEMKSTLAETLPQMTSLECLTLMYDAIIPGILWAKMRPNLTQLKELEIKCAQPPYAAMSTIPSLGLTLSALPQHVLGFTNIRDLHVVQFRGAELPPEVGFLPELKSLVLERCDALTTLPSSLRRLSKLSVLKVGFCQGLTQLPSCIGNLPSLKTLHVTHCRRLQRLPDSIARLTSVEELHVEQMPVLLELPEGLGKVRSLRDLQVSGYERSSWVKSEGPLRAIPESLGRLTRLTKLLLQELPDLPVLPTSLGSLKSLRVMHCQGLDSLQHLPMSVTQLQNLEYLDIVRSDKIVALPASLGALSALTGLRMSCCDGIRLLPESVSMLGNLRRLHMEACGELIDLPVGLANLTGLRELVVRNCRTFKFGNKSVPPIASLRFLQVSGCPRQRRLPACLEALTKLRMIKCSPGMIKRAPQGLAVEMEADLEADEIENAPDEEDDVEEEDDGMDEEEDGEEDDGLSSNEEDEDDDDPISAEDRLKPSTVTQAGAVKMEVDEPPARSGHKRTHIHDLNDVCLTKVLSLVGNTQLPIQRPKYRDVQVTHPLQCALVCKRWRLCAPAAVHTINLVDLEAEEALAEQGPHLTALQHLVLFSDNRCPGALQEIAVATPQLHSLELDCTLRFPMDVARALRLWTNLERLHLAVNFAYSPDMSSTLLDTLPAMTSLKALSLFFDDIVPGSLWAKLRPAMPQLKELVVKCAQPPVPSMSAIPTLGLVLSALPPHVLRFANVRDLHLVQFREAELPPALGSLPGLETLVFEHCSSLWTLPSTLGRLSALKVLKVGFCHGLTRLPACIGDLRALKVFHVTHCRGLQRLPDSIARLTGVEELHVEEMPALLELPEGLGGMRSLRDLQVSGYQRNEWMKSEGPLRAIPESLGQLTRLTKLLLLELPDLHELPESLGGLRSLREMHCQGLDSLECLPESITELRRLEYLDIVRSDRIVELPASLGYLSALTALRMSCCDGIELLPESVGVLGNLRRLHMEACGELIDLPVGLANLPRLRELVVTNCRTFRFRNKSVPPIASLRFLQVSGCPRQRRLPAGLEALTELRMIKCSPGMIARAPQGLAVEMEADSEADEIED